MEGQGDGWHNGPSSYHIPLLIGNRPPNDDPDMEYIVILDFIVNQEIVFVNEGEQWPDNDVDMNVSENENIDIIIDDDNQLEAAVGAEVEIGVTRSAEDDPPLESSGNVSKDDGADGDGEEASGSFRWWDEFDGNSSDGSAEQDVNEVEAPRLLQTQANVYLMSLSGHLAHGSGIIVLAEGGRVSKEGDAFWEQGLEEDPLRKEEGNSGVMN
ncbi:noggin-2 isoform X1 [Syngnathus acus]|uniref:noggin-2 isoform X1 n=1 Tax=Syngnathus acus TaxID=161584 RepID=UPI001885D852|nr:noggin-2 isoform X1 [Syngnathus acus]